MTMTKITAPYGFVPLSEKIVEPDWLKLVDGEAPPVHDIPFKDGLCGTLELEITAETPIFVRGTKGKGEEFFQLEDGQYAIPGTSIRGALRNIVEIITFSRFNRVNNHRYAVRDLHDRNLYGQYMADIVKDPKTGKGEPMPLVNAGWLTRSGVEGEYRYEIEVCDFAKFEYRELEALASEKGIRNFRPGEKQSSVRKYNAWEPASLETKVDFMSKRPPTVNGRRMLSEYGVAKRGSQGKKMGTLVMTGQPSRWVPDQAGQRRGAGNAKHHDFVFFERVDKARLEVKEEVFKDFEFAHSDRGQQNSLGKSQKPNEEWGFWQKKMEVGKRVPVFFLTGPKGQNIRSFGLAMMFRLSCDHSIHEAVGHVNARHIDDKAPLDFAEGLFGTVREKNRGVENQEKALTLKGRVGISHAVCTKNVHPEPMVKAVLGAPKASYTPNYVEQQPGSFGGQPLQDHSGKPRYQTWMDVSSRPRGWKRYRALTKTWIPDPPSGSGGRALDLEKVASKFRPLPANATFVAHVDIHNLRPVELGALLWAIQFGEDSEARHTLGMARPLGFGRSLIKVIKSAVRDMNEQSVDVQKTMSEFENWMDTQIPGWKDSPHIKELLALAQPVHPKEAFYQKLDPGARINEFVEAKREGLALPSAVEHALGTARVVTNGGPHKLAKGGPTSLEVQAMVRAKTIAETTKKGGVMFEILGTDKKAILHPSSAPPPSLDEGSEHDFIVMANANPVALKWVDPNAPPPQPKGSNDKKKRGGGRPGFRR